MSVKIIPFDASHIDIIELRDEDVDELFSRPEGIEALAEAAASGEAFTVLIDGRILTCGGITPLWAGVGQAWVLPSKYVHDHPVEFVKQVRGFLEAIIKSHGYHRVQCVVSEALTYGERWMLALGFEKEGLMRQYTPKGINYFMYARVG